MAKITLNDVANLNNQSSAVAIINTNSSAIETALENTLSRDGTSPNTMEAELDMNSNRIVNLPAPVDDTEPVRLGDLATLGNGTFQVDDLLDVTLTLPLVDDQFLRYDSATGKWINETATGAGNAPDSADYLVKTANAGLTSERVVTDNTSITWDWGTAGQAKASRAALTGDVTASANVNITTIANDAVTFAKMQNIATDSLVGRDTAGSGDPENILLNSTLSMDGSGNLQRAALTGDVTASAGSNATTIATSAVTLGKMADLATSRVIGRTTAGTGAPESLTGAQVGGLIGIDDLSDVVITSRTTGDLLQYDGTHFVNSPSTAFGAPSTADYLTKTAQVGLSAERVVTDTATVTWDWSTPGQAKATASVSGAGGLVAANNLSDVSSPSTSRTNLGLAIGTNVQAYDAQLSSVIGQNSKSAAYTTVLTDGGKHIYHPSADTTARTFTIDSNANVAYPIGTVITFVNDSSAGVVTISITSDTLVLMGTGSTGNRTLAANGLATALKVTSTRWVISGTGLT